MVLRYSATEISEEDIADIHQQMLEEFIKTSPGLIGMVLVGIRNNENDLTVEVSCGGRRTDAYRACAAVLESILRTGSLQGSRIESPEEAKLVAKIADVLMVMAGDDPDELRDAGRMEFIPVGKKN